MALDDSNVSQLDENHSPLMNFSKPKTTKSIVIIGGKNNPFNVGNNLPEIQIDFQNNTFDNDVIPNDPLSDNVQRIYIKNIKLNNLTINMNCTISEFVNAVKTGFNDGHGEQILQNCSTPTNGIRICDICTCCMTIKTH